MSPTQKLDVATGNIALGYNQTATNSLNKIFATAHAAGNAPSQLSMVLSDGSDGAVSIKNTRPGSYNCQAIHFDVHEGGVAARGDAMVINYTGNVGIGTTSPQKRLHVVATSYASGIAVGQNDAVSLMLLGYDITNNVGAIGSYAGGSGSTLTINRDGGNVLIGTTSTLNSNIGLSVQASQGSGGAAVITGYNSASSAADNSPVLALMKAMTTTTSSARFVQFYADGTTTPMGGIVGNGASNVQFAAISDAREKTNVQALEGSLAKISALKPVAFDWIKSGEHINSGFIAQDVEKVFPEFVVSNMSNEGEEQRYGLTGGLTSGIIPHIVAALQELKLDNDSLRKRLAALEAK